MKKYLDANVGDKVFVVVKEDYSVRLFEGVITKKELAHGDFSLDNIEVKVHFKHHHNKYEEDILLYGHGFFDRSGGDKARLDKCKLPNSEKWEDVNSIKYSESEFLFFCKTDIFCFYDMNTLKENLYYDFDETKILMQNYEKLIGKVEDMIEEEEMANYIDEEDD